MGKSFQEWLSEGEQLYNAAMGEFRALEAQIEGLEHQLAAKKAEVNQIAQVIGKPPVDSSRRLTAQLVESEHVTTVSIPASGGMARALTGRGGWTGKAQG